jgi:hypothetical protein
MPQKADRASQILKQEVTFIDDRRIIYYSPGTDECANDKANGIAVS